MKLANNIVLKQHAGIDQSHERVDVAPSRFKLEHLSCREAFMYQLGSTGGGILRQGNKQIEGLRDIR